MKKSILFLAMLTAGIGAVQAQTFEKGTNVVSALIGLGSSLGYSLGTQSPAISLSFEHGTWDAGSTGVVSMGAYLGMKRFSYKTSTYKESWNYTIIGVRGAYHYTALKSDKLDVYGGLMLSYNMLNFKWKSTDGSGGSGNDNLYGNGGVGLTGFVGGRYFLNQSLALNAELGYGVAYLNLGLSLKLGGSSGK